MNRKEEIYHVLSQSSKPLSASNVADYLSLERSNVSRYLFELHQDGDIQRIEGRPVLYQVQGTLPQNHLVSFDYLVGLDDSLKIPIQQGKAAMLYPPNGLHTIIFGESGTGKSLFAECMYAFGLASNMLEDKAPFISFNCADYASNPQLLFSHIFGVKKGAFTGADEDKSGLISQANGGILFLDEIHRLPPEGQEMLFTFIDKGEYRPLGESSEVHQARVQIIGATTESSDIFLMTFKRRIPMSITLPPLSERSLEERFNIILLFLRQEATRLNQSIVMDRNALLSFILYHSEGNIGQIKRDLKLVCAKAFLNYRTNEEERLVIQVTDLPLFVQKGLLKKKKNMEALERIVDIHEAEIIVDPGTKDKVWSQDTTQNMDVYTNIDEDVLSLGEFEPGNVDLEALMDKNINQYFDVYVDELSRNDIQKDLIEEDIWKLMDALYHVAEVRLGRQFNQKTRFTFALHLQSSIERIRQNRAIVHPNLNEVRKKYLTEFQVAIELSGMIEEALDVDIPFDEIGFITMFLTLDLSDEQQQDDTTVSVFLLMHGQSTATSMLEAVQELLGTESGVAFNMPLDREVTAMYNDVKQYVLDNKEELSKGVLLLTDMGSLNSFSHMLMEETGVVIKSISMVTTLVVLEAVRLASSGRGLKDIYNNIQLSFESAVHAQFKLKENRPKAVVVACFTGEGVAKKLYERLEPSVKGKDVHLLRLQILEKKTFINRMDELLDTYDIKAIVGTVDVSYPYVPFFSAYDVFQDKGLAQLNELLSEELSVEAIAASLDGAFKEVESPVALLRDVKKSVMTIEKELGLTLTPGVLTGMMLHVAILVDNLLSGEHMRLFHNFTEFKKKHRYDMDIVTMGVSLLEHQYGVSLPEDEVAYLTEMYVKNAV